MILRLWPFLVLPSTTPLPATMLRERLTVRMNPLPLVRKSDQRRAHSSPRRQPVAMAPMNTLNRYLSVQPKNQLRVNCDDDSTLLSMVAQRLGVTAMPELCLQNPTESVCVLELTPPTKRVLGAALPNSPSKEAVRFASYLRQRFAYQEA